jgi:hypothetical protein
MGKAVATEGDVSPTAGSIDPPGAAKSSGKWTSDPQGVSYTSYDNLKIGGKKVIYEAKLKFTYKSGKTPDGKPFPDTDDTVTLTAKTTVLQKGESDVLLDGDEKSNSPTGNKLSVSTQNNVTSD